MFDAMSEALQQAINNAQGLFNFTCWLVGLIVILLLVYSTVWHLAKEIWRMNRSKVRKMLRKNEKLMKWLNY